MEYNQRHIDNYHMQGYRDGRMPPSMPIRDHRKQVTMFDLLVFLAACADQLCLKNTKISISKHFFFSPFFGVCLGLLNTGGPSKI